MKPPFIGKGLYNGGFAQFLANSGLIGFSYTLQHSKTVKLQTEEIQAILEAYYIGDARPSEEIHQQHIRRFIKYVQSCKKDSSSDYESLFSRHAIFIDDSKGEAFHQAKSCYLDAPFTETGLHALYRSAYEKKKIALWTQYKEIPGFEDFAQAIGVQKALEIKKVPTDKNSEKEELQVDCIKNKAKRTQHKTDDDYTIDDIENILKCQNISVAKLVWCTMCNADPNAQRAKFRPNQKYKEKTAPSQLIHYLRSTTWIPNKDGKFCYPKDVSKNDLPKGFDYDDRNGWLTAIGLVAKEYTEDDLKFLDNIKQHPDLYLDTKRKLKQDPDKGNFPTNESKDPERRKCKVKGQVKDAPKKIIEKKEQNVRTSKVEIDAGSATFLL